MSINRKGSGTDRSATHQSRPHTLGAAAIILSAMVLLLVCGCEKPPTFSELIGNKKKDETAAPAKVAAQPMPVQPSAPAPPPKPEPPKKTPQEVIAQFNSTPPEQRSNAQLIELSNVKEGLEQFTAMDLTHSGVNDQGMVVLPKFEKLQKLVIDACTYGASGLENVSKIKGLTELSMNGGPSVDIGAGHDQAMKHLKDMRQLKTLRLDRARFSPDALANSVGTLDGLEILSVSSNQFSDADLEHLAGLTKLKELHLYGTQVTDYGCKYLLPFVDLEVLDLANLKEFRGQGLKDLVVRGKLKKLKSLILSDDYNLQLPAYEAIKKLVNLETLDVAHSQMNDYYFKNAIATHPKLEVLGIGDTGFTDEGMKALPRLKNLKRLAIDTARISDASLGQIAKLKSLEYLYIRATSCTAAKVKALKDHLPPDCVVFFNQQKL